MKDKITCFKLNWDDCGLCCGEGVVEEEITIYRNDNYMIFKKLNSSGVICSYEIIYIEKENISEFFVFLEKIYDKLENDYRVEVCDGSSWIVRMWHSSHKVKKVCGTIEYPPYGKQIESYIRSFIILGKSVIVPKMFGCR